MKVSNYRIFWAYIACILVSQAKIGRAIDSDEPFRSAAFLGRGNTGIAIADEEDAIFNNPAGIALGDGIYKKIPIFSPFIEFSQDTKDFARQMTLEKGDPTETLRAHEGKPQHIGINLLTGIILRRVALTFYGATQSTALLFKDKDFGGFESVRVDSFADGGLNFTIADKLFHPRIHWGINAKYIHRLQASVKSSATEIQKLSEKKTEEFFMRGQGVGADLGLRYQSMGRTPIAVGLTVKDMFDTSFTPIEETTLPKAKWPLRKMRQTINVGFAIIPGTKTSQFKLLMDLHDLTNAYGASYFKRLHLGAELSVKKAIGFSAGLNQGYSTFGFYLDFHVFRLDLGIYGEETGTTVGAREDKRLFMRLYSGF